MTIYFDEEGEAYLFEIASPICEISVSEWMPYSRGKKGTTWDIIEGVFTPLMSPEDIQHTIDLPIRESERRSLYEYADEQISLCDNYILLGVDTEYYSNLKIEWLQYKMSVRKTVEQETFPFEVTYPDKPDEDE